MNKKIRKIFLVIYLFFALQNFYAQVTINSNARLIIGSDAYLLSGGDMDINSDGLLNLYGCATINGTLTNSAGTGGLVVHSDATGTGSLIESSGVSATVERFITQNIYHYITPPVSGQSISLLQDGTPHTDFDLFWYDENYSGDLGPAWIDASEQTGTDDLEVGLGYTYAYNISDRTLEFVGNTNQGNINETVTYTYNETYSTSEWYFGWNLVGNPYPSRINAETFIEDEDNSNIYGTLYFWDESGVIEYNDYATWNKTGSTQGGGGQTPNGYIDVGQAFFVHYGSGTSPSTNAVTFKNTMRVHDEAVFFKNSDPWRFKISLESEEGDYNETLIGFVPGCSEGFDNKYDGFKLKGNTKIALYTKLVEDDGYDYAIQALPSLTSEGVTVKLGMNTGKKGFYTLNVVSKENFNDTVAVYLEDAYQNIYTNLHYDPEYHFSVEEAGEHNDRFYLHFNNYGVGIEEDEFENGFHIYPFYGDIIIENDNPRENLTAMIFDAGGRLLHSEKLNKNQKSEINLNASTGIYLVRIIGEKEVFTRKILVK